MATETRATFPSECFTSAWTSVTGYDIGEQATTVTAMVGCPSPFRVYESPSNAVFPSEDVTDLPDLPQCCGPFTKVTDPELSYLEGTNVLCPESYGITKETVKTDGTTGGSCVATADGIETGVVTSGDLPTITQIASFHVNWDQEVLSEKYGVTIMAPTASSASDAVDGNTSDSSESKLGRNLAAIVAPSVIGGLILIGILVFAAWCTQRRRSRRTEPSQYPPFKPQQQQTQYSTPGGPMYPAPDVPTNPGPVYEPVAQPQQVQYPAAGNAVYSAPDAPVNPVLVYEPVPVPQAYVQTPIGQTPLQQLPEADGQERYEMGAKH